MTPQADSDVSALFANTGFVLLTGLSPHSEVSIDASPVQAIKRFSGWKLVPPGLHLITFSPSSKDASSGSWGQNDETRRAESSGIAIRRGIWKQVDAGRTVVMRYSHDLEGLEEASSDEDVEEVVNIDRLRELDDQMAPYNGHDGWPDLTSSIDMELLRAVLGKTIAADTLSESAFDEAIETAKSKIESLDAMRSAAPEGTLQFPAFDLRRSWRSGAVGEEVTRYSKDKSWLLADTVLRKCSGGELSLAEKQIFWLTVCVDPSTLLGHLQIAFLLFLQLHNYSSLLVYKRLLGLFCQSSSILVDKELSVDIKCDWPALFRDLVRTLDAQVMLLPEDFFTDSPDAGLENFIIMQLVSLSQNLMSCCSSMPDTDKWSIAKASEQLRKTVESRFRWQLPRWRERLDVTVPGEPDQHHATRDGMDSDYEEEGDDAPVIVEL